MTSAENTLILRRLKIEKLLGVAPTELFFRDEFNVLLGTNAAGKTTLLRLIAAIVLDHFGDIAERSPELAIDYDLERRGERGYVDRATFRLTLTKPPEPEDRTQPTRHLAVPRGELRVTRNGNLETFFAKGAPSIIDGEGLDIEIPAAAILSPQYLFASAPRDGDGDDEVPGWAEWPVNRFGRFDEALDLYERMFAGTLEIVVHDTRKTARVHRGPLAFSFTSAAREALRESPELASQSLLELHSTRIPALQAAADLFGFKTASALFVVNESVPAANGKRTTFRPPIIVFRDAHGGFDTQNMLSFGQQRMLTFLFYWHETRGTPAVMDELVNGLHHGWVDQCMSMLRDRQCFFAAQNPLLLDELSFSSAADVAKTFVVCSRGNDRRMRWTALKPRQAQNLWESTLAGVQHVHEILRDEGLW